MNIRWIQFGVVKFVDRKRQFGFIALDVGEGEDVFFHFNDGENIEAGNGEPRFCGGKLNREPKKGDVIVFQRQLSYKGPRAAPWGFGTDHWRAECGMQV